MAGLVATFGGLMPEDAHAAAEWLTATGNLTLREIRDALRSNQRLFQTQRERIKVDRLESPL